jgi:sterol desaturase/sphingolipid hydroxylase (fatty acid hydroxylase superfamily)
MCSNKDAFGLRTKRLTEKRKKLNLATSISSELNDNTIMTSIIMATAPTVITRLQSCWLGCCVSAVAVHKREEHESRNFSNSHIEYERKQKQLKHKSASWIEYWEREKRMKGWRIALGILAILFVFWVIISVLLSSWMTNQWQNEWWQILVGLTVFWLFYILIAYLAYYVCHDEQEY